MGKSFVRVEKKSCLVCGRAYDTGALLITQDRTKPATEWGLCPEHAAFRDRNLIAMVEVDPAKSPTFEDNDDYMSPDLVTRTGTVVYLNRATYRHIFYGEPPDNGVCYVEPIVIATLQRVEQMLRGGTQH